MCSIDEETTLGYMVKKLSAQGECLGSKRRRKTWQPAKSPGELATSDEPRISEWGNPIEAILLRWTEYIGPSSEPRELKHLSTWRKRNQPRFP